MEFSTFISYPTSDLKTKCLRYTTKTKLLEGTVHNTDGYSKGTCQGASLELDSLDLQQTHQMAETSTWWVSNKIAIYKEFLEKRDTDTPHATCIMPILSTINESVSCGSLVCNGEILGSPSRHKLWNQSGRCWFSSILHNLTSTIFKKKKLSTTIKTKINIQ